MKSVRRFGVIIASLCAAAAAVATPAPALAQAGDDRSGTALLITVQFVDEPEQPIRTALLRCGTDGGSHRSAAAACRDLSAVDGDFAALPDVPGMCTREYRPVLATAVGFWSGRMTSYRAVFGNNCLLLRATGSVFDI
ncbi:SSI family serine proteinase inhibitor [Actinoplanes flavus]|uniref:Proteinase inhibitor I4 serpin n=1 Tax=Actinoplanes flavus TaxID=2820290 RepID=A0ABS3UL43_9ACTN|nr:SSI family serine proteinase inhibitor [Actinoplanes flavus]MBO3739512.1 proteinase inhibitor I4 serpin [Actinoplanes flavus]